MDHWTTREFPNVSFFGQCILVDFLSGSSIHWCKWHVKSCYILLHSYWFLPLSPLIFALYIFTLQCLVHQSVQFNSVTQWCPTLWDPMNRSTPGLPVYHQLLKFTQTHVHWVSDTIQPSHHLCPLLLLPVTPPSLRVLFSESTLHMKWPKYWSFSFSISPFNEHPGLISFRMDWLDLLAVQGTLKSLLQHHSSKASILQWSAFIIVQLSHAYMITGKTIALTRRTLVGKVMSLLLNTV